MEDSIGSSGISKLAKSGSSQSKELKTPAEWVKVLRVKPYYLSGVMIFAGWSDDHKITESEFKSKLNEWLKRPIGGKK